MGHRGPSACPRASHGLGLGNTVQFVASSQVATARDALGKLPVFLKDFFLFRLAHLVEVVFVSVNKQQILHFGQASSPVLVMSRTGYFVIDKGEQIFSTGSGATNIRPAYLWHSIKPWRAEDLEVGGICLSGFHRLRVALFFIEVALEMQSVAVGWQVYEITKRPLDLGLVGLAQFLPELFCFWLPGTLRIGLIAAGC